MYTQTRCIASLWPSDLLCYTTCHQVSCKMSTFLQTVMVHVTSASTFYEDRFDSNCEKKKVVSPDFSHLIPPDVWLNIFFSYERLLFHRAPPGVQFSCCTEHCSSLEVTFVYRLWHRWWSCLWNRSLYKTEGEM